VRHLCRLLEGTHCKAGSTDSCIMHNMRHKKIEPIRILYFVEKKKQRISISTFSYAFIHTYYALCKSAPRFTITPIRPFHTNLPHNVIHKENYLITFLTFRLSLRHIILKVCKIETLCLYNYL